MTALRKLTPLVLFALFAILTTAQTNAEQLSDKEKESLNAIATKAIEFGELCVSKGMLEKARFALKCATDAAPELEVLGEFQQLVDYADPIEVTDEAKEEVENAEEEFRRFAGKEYLSLYRRKGRSVDNRFLFDVARAVNIDPSNSRGWTYASRELDDILSSKDKTLAARYIPLCLTAKDASDRYKGKFLRGIESKLKAGTFLLKASTHHMYYFISLPSSWDAKKSWPVLLSVEGAGCGFKGNHRGFASARGKLPLIVITLHTFSNTNKLNPKKYHYEQETLNRYNGDRMTFDYGGYEAVMADIKAMFNAQDRVFVTGFSGGGKLTYYMTLQHPEQVRGAFPSCANFQPSLGRGAEQVPEEFTDTPIHIFTGEKDPHKDDVFGQKPGIEGQSDWAMEALKGVGYTNIKRTMLTGVGHSNCRGKVIAEIESLGTATAK
ncbi:MAG: hypothetical protein U5N86_06070 [Planctomycetota bacterium]|nr:hypothetical protein [Planctomycetota bacterium]